MARRPGVNKTKKNSLTIEKSSLSASDIAGLKIVLDREDVLHSLNVIRVIQMIGDSFYCTKVCLMQ